MNPFDKFDGRDAAEANPFDRFGDPASPAVKATARPVPKVTADQMRDFAAGGKRPSTMKDVGKSFAAGLYGTLANANPMNALTGGAVLDTLHNAADVGAGILDMAGGKRPTFRPQTAPGARASQLQISAAGQDYAPQTTAGKWAKTTGAMAPNALSPGSAVARVAAVALPTIGTEAAGQIAHNMGASPQVEAGARFAGGLAGGIASSVRISPKATAPASMSLDELRDASDGAWKQVDASGFRFKQDDVKTLAGDISKAVADEGGSALYPQAAAIADRVDALAKSGDLTVGQLNRLKSQVGEKLMQPGSTEAHVGAAIRGKIEGLIASANEPSLVEARDLYTRLKKVEEVTNRMDSADLRASSTYSGGNTVNAMRQNIRPLIDPKSPQRLRNLTPEETKALRQFVDGSGGQNAMREVSKILNNRFLQGMAAVPTLGAGAVAMDVAGRVVRKAGELSAEKSLQRVLDLMAAGGKQPAANALTGQPPRITFEPGAGLVGSTAINSLAGTR